MSPLVNTSACFSNIGQFDGNVSLSETQLNTKKSKIKTALNLPVVASYNCRSLFPKLGSMKTEIIERKLDCIFASEVWEQSENKEHLWEIEKMLEIDGLKYISKSRPAKNRGGGVALIVNLQKYSCERLNINTPKGLEAVWGLLKPKSSDAEIRNIIVCSFYSPPNNGRNTRLADYMVSTLHMLSTKYPDAGIILGGDKNKMDLSPILSCGLRLRQEVNKSTRQGAILDVLIMNLSKFYNSPVIVPPLSPDDPSTAKPSDHFVPISIPHTDHCNPPARNYTYHTVRPIPQSGLLGLSQWLAGEEWTDITNCKLSPTEQVEIFHKTLQNNLNIHCPTKVLKLGSHDKPWMNLELKKLHRLKSREYVRNGKSEKYRLLLKQFQLKYKKAAEKYLTKNTEDLKQSNPGQAYRILKKLGAHPGDSTDDNTFTLPSHLSANLSAEESAERIAEHFSAISQEFSPLDTNNLPSRVKVKLLRSGAAPTITYRDTLKKMQSAKKAALRGTGRFSKPIDKRIL